MYARVVRFTDATPERIDAVVARVEESDGPPPGVPAKAMKLLVDESQSTAIFIGFFDSEDDMREGSAVLDQMDTGDVPGTRASVDLCEVKIERDEG